MSSESLPSRIPFDQIEAEKSQMALNEGVVHAGYGRPQAVDLVKKLTLMVTREELPGEVALGPDQVTFRFEKKDPESSGPIFLSLVGSEQGARTIVQDLGSSFSLNDGQIIRGEIGHEYDENSARWNILLTLNTARTKIFLGNDYQIGFWLSFSARI